MTDRVLVLVPMRANSQTISRKNVRGVGDTSLAATAIRRAKRLGDYLAADGHDVIVCVATDDTGIAGLAAANDVSVYRRQPVDATQTIAQAAFDVATVHTPTVTVVLQATSPFLPFDDLIETVDAVLCGDAQSASTITPVSHLAWSRTGQPLHTTRVNRQQMLPEVYTETGAVHVTRGFHPAADGVSLVSTNHYMTETFGAAAIDIDNPDDLVAARAVHDRERRVLILVYGNTARHGGGHLSRARLLAEELELHTTVDVWSPDIDRHPFDRWRPAGPPTPDLADRYAAVIVDMLDNTDDVEPWLAACEQADVPVIALEREHVQTRRPVLRINELAPVGELYGPRFATVDTALRGYPHRERSTIRNVVVCFGASDPNRWTMPVVEALAEHHPSLTLTAPGRCLDINDTHAAGFDPDELAYLLWSADLAIIGRGRTQFEAAYLGVPFLSVAQNDIEAEHWQLANGIYLNDVDSIGVNVAQAVEQIRAATQRDDWLLGNLSAGLRAEVDGRGVERVAAAIIAAMHW